MYLLSPIGHPLSWIWDILRRLIISVGSGWQLKQQPVISLSIHRKITLMLLLLIYFHGKYGKKPKKLSSSPWQFMIKNNARWQSHNLMLYVIYEYFFHFSLFVKIWSGAQVFTWRSQAATINHLSHWPQPPYCMCVVLWFLSLRHFKMTHRCKMQHDINTLIGDLGGCMSEH